ncbi:hypothetical protein [Sphingomonas koreensis]
MIAKPLLVALGIGMFLTPAAALACRSVHSHRYVVLQHPPSRLPAGAVLLRVRLGEKLPYGGDAMKLGAMARILAGPGAGRMIRLKPGLWTSCTGWFEGDRTGYVVGWRDRPDTLIPVEYRARGHRSSDEEWSRGYERPKAHP